MLEYEERKERLYRTAGFLRGMMVGEPYGLYYPYFYYYQVYEPPVSVLLLRAFLCWLAGLGAQDEPPQQYRFCRCPNCCLNFMLGPAARAPPP